jgi:uncharacterized protein
MSQKITTFLVQLKRLNQDLREGFRLLYWTYFKPFTLQNWLNLLESDIKITTPFLALIKLSIYNNNSIKIYLRQLLLLLILPPLITVLISYLIFDLNYETFNWVWNGFFISSWLLGLVISYRWLNKGIFTLLLLNIILIINLPYFQLDWQTNLIPAIEGMIAGSISLIVANLPLTVFFGIGVTLASQLSEMIFKNYLISEQFLMNLGLVIGAISGLGLGLNWMLDLGIEEGIKRGFFWGVASGVALGIGTNLTWGLLWSLSFIGGIIRFYFWLPEAIYIWLLSLVNQLKKQSLKRLLLPIYLDELAILPLPKITKTIIFCYFQGSPQIQETLLYLLNYSNRGHLVDQSLKQITLHSLSQCKTITDMVTIPEKLLWIPNFTNSSELTTTLANFAKVSQAVKGFQGTPNLDFQLEILNAATLVLEQLINYLDQIKSKFSRACIKIIKKWLIILETTQKKIEKL